MESLKLGVIGLPDAEQRLVATLFRLHQVEPSFIWTLAAKGPFDAVLVDQRVSREEVKRLVSSSTQVKWLAAPGEVVPDRLTRPLRSDLLINWLNSIEVVLLHGSGDAFASTAAHSRLDHSHSHSRPPEELQRMASARAALAPKGKSWAERLCDSDVVVKLTRWPSAALLGKDVSRIRIATMISRRPMSVGEVSSLARVPLGTCHGFLATLGDHGLLQFESEARPMPVPGRGRVAVDEARRKAESKNRLGMSLIRSIRQRFGI